VTSEDSEFELGPALEQLAGRVRPDADRTDVVFAHLRDRIAQTALRRGDPEGLQVAPAHPGQKREVGKIVSRLMSPLGTPTLFGASLVLVIGALAATFWSDRPSTIAARHTQTFTTGAAEQKQVVLRDGSQVVLGPATTLVVETGAADQLTAARVVGQALFTVHHAPNRLFHVHAGQTVVRVLGTTFSVRRYDSDAAARVAVVDGRVTVSGRGGRGSGTVLSAGMLAVIDSITTRITPKIDPNEQTGWVRGEIVFRRTPVCDVVSELGRVYDMDIRVTDSVLARQTLSWKLLTSQRSLSDVLEFLSITFDAHAVRTGRTITLVPGRLIVPPRSKPSSSSLSEPQYGK
jgi:ferric-dicitrate binding protein FerR (iron transport regulator)